MLDYFIQYMEAENALHLLHFWFSVESFKNVMSSPKLGVDYKQLSTPTSDKQCDTVSMEMGVCDYVTTSGDQVVNMTELERSLNRSGSKTTIHDPKLAPNTERTNKTVSRSGGKNTRPDGDGHRTAAIGERKATEIINSTIKEQGKLAVHDKEADGIQTHQGMLKQLSLSKEVSHCSSVPMAILLVHREVTSVCLVLSCMLIGKASVVCK